jgi:hypothetical protein
MPPSDCTPLSLHPICTVACQLPDDVSSQLELHSHAHRSPLSSAVSFPFWLFQICRLSSAACLPCVGASQWYGVRVLLVFHGSAWSCHSFPPPRAIAAAVLLSSSRCSVLDLTGKATKPRASLHQARDKKEAPPSYIRHAYHTLNRGGQSETDRNREQRRECRRERLASSPQQGVQRVDRHTAQAC